MIEFQIIPAIYEIIPSALDFLESCIYIYSKGKQSNKYILSKTQSIINLTHTKKAKNPF